MKLLLNKLLDT